MRLNDQDLELFYKLHPSLLVFTNQKLGIVSDLKTIEDYFLLKVEQRLKIRDKLYENINLIYQFYEANPYNFTERELGIIISWKHFIKGKFFIYKQYKKYCAFIEENSSTKVYGVLALSDPFDVMVSHKPILVDTVLLPFKDEIIYDGYVIPYNVYFGASIRRSIKKSFEIAVAKYNIIENLPFKPPPEEEINAGLIRCYVKDEEYYEDEIASLVENNNELLKLYHQERGKVHAKKHIKQLRQLGIFDVWFAIIEGMIIASGKTNEQLKKNMKEIVPKDKIEFVYYFKVTKK